ncbi:efflux RND transporter periplasmic adaptor subunit [Acuticoccus sediminis]|uniref:efflux RND transporter periplasmic adaptor subunit n=1 Tax=Acuticoccus sediminis TaxID=2184697 RepID=UPI001CFE8F44|nr:efflux RND transporter periplasmic adaptor subunit [Acuticoccus sediminis]
MTRILISAALLGTAALISACSPEGGESAASPAAERPPAEVGTIEVVPEDLQVVSELPGRINATRIAEVRPRVGGIILERVFEQGTTVAAGDVLFRIDPVTYDVAVLAAQASVERAEATRLEAQQNEERVTTLLERNVSSQAEVDRAKASRLQADADVAVAKAELRAAQIDLGFTNVTAPISGRIGRANITEGALVSAAGSEVLTTIQALDPVYADILQPVSELLALRRAVESGALRELEPGVAEVRLYLDDGTLYPHPGRLLFSEATVERTSGQVTLRAEFPNPDDVLLPGMYVRVAVEQAQQNDAIAVPSQAVQRDASGAAQLYLVSGENTAEIRSVRLGRAIGNRMVVEDGLATGDNVIVDGVQKIGPGAPVKPVAWTDPSAGPREQADAGTADTSPDGARELQDASAADAPATPADTDTVAN